jgi:large-conductance mechanosensitive channel
MDMKNELADFITNNRIIGVTAGVTIGLVSKDVILSLVQDIVIPIIVILLLRLKIKKLTVYLPNKDNGLNITKFISSLITWILAIVCTFIFVQYAFVKFFGAKSADINQKQNHNQNHNKDMDQISQAF